MDKGVWYFYISDERKNQHIKNPQSQRVVPIHPKLIELGLLDYINRIREQSYKAEDCPGRIPDTIIR